MITTRTAEIDAEEGIVVVRVKGDVLQSLDDARTNLTAAKARRGARGRCPLLVDIRRSAPLSPEVRHFYAGDQVADAFTALALVTEASPLGRMMGNIYLRVARLGCPTRLFVDDLVARSWLRDLP